MTKRLLTLGLSLLIMVGASTGYAQNVQKTANVLMTRSYDVDKDLFGRFEKESGISVNVVEGKLDELIGRIKKAGMLTSFLSSMAASSPRPRRPALFNPSVPR